MRDEIVRQSRRRHSFAEHEMSIPVQLVLTLLTFGIWNLYWNYRQMQACNEMSGREQFSFVLWILLCIVTLGIYFIYYQYKMGRCIVEIQRRLGADPFDGLPIISTLGSMIGFSIVVDAIHQHEINKLVRHST